MIIVWRPPIGKTNEIAVFPGDWLQTVALLISLSRDSRCTLRISHQLAVIRAATLVYDILAYERLMVNRL
jgi:hypothetical protein